MKKIPTLLEFIQKYRPDVAQVLGPDHRGLIEFKGFTRMEDDAEVEIPLENLEELYGLIPLYRPYIERMKIFN